ncbi:phosphatase PAP2 family protein [Stenotrophomonas sp. 24(2023)]|uniref:phosphatase PAP2 family protein n=1 Tax=Stenotrophomonas sp. 24(2023) TaxID=3068324 RepID=UPI0027E0A298|nr:phosphatase PAP2 family protein [Stenotrophomonas sp. 24(2023)]WMJ68980.1 phosphatase PAP2 family protein [Stenotrophomonas sp. 24(2023)]
MHAVWPVLSSLGDSRFLLPMAIALMLLQPGARTPLHRRWRVAIGCAAGITVVTKLLFMGWGIGIKTLDFTGISGHAAMASSIYPVAAWLCAGGRSSRPGAWAMAGAVLAIAIGYSRLPIGAHSPAEVAAGLMLGLSAAALTLRRICPGPAIAGWKPLLAVFLAVLVPVAMQGVRTHELIGRLAMALSERDHALQRSPR